jgi:hypothetical protein
MLFFINGFYDGDQKNKLPDPTALLKVGFLFDRVKTKTGTVKKKKNGHQTLKHSHAPTPVLKEKKHGDRKKSSFKTSKRI